MISLEHRALVYLRLLGTNLTLAFEPLGTWTLETRGIIKGLSALDLADSGIILGSNFGIW